MSEQIREIAERAVFDEIGKDYSLYFNLTKDKVDRFAELIIKEVFAATKDIKADYLRQQLATQSFGEKAILSEGRAALNRLEEELKRRFGV